MVSPVTRTSPGGDDPRLVHGQDSCVPEDKWPPAVDVLDLVRVHCVSTSLGCPAASPEHTPHSLREHISPSSVS